MHNEWNIAKADEERKIDYMHRMRQQIKGAREKELERSEKRNESEYECKQDKEKKLKLCGSRSNEKQDLRSYAIIDGVKNENCRNTE